MFPSDYRCPDPSGVCTCDGKKQLSYSLPGSDQQYLGIDVLEDPQFPPDLFFHVFRQPNDETGVDFAKALALKDGDDHVIDNCSSLGPGSFGLYVVEGNCDLQGNARIGTAEAPVFLLLLGAENDIGGTVEIFGTLFLSNAINSGAAFVGNGNLTIYGALMAEGDISKFSGNLKLVYVDDVVDRSFDIGDFASVPGGWVDFHPDWR
jgi:hypothetical protein